MAIAPRPISPNQRILIVEDEALIALSIEAVILSVGCLVKGPVSTVARALAVLANEKPDAALLDIDLGNETVFPVADALAEQAIPFIFLTANRVGDLPARHCHRPLLSKPFLDQEVIGALGAILGDR